MFQRPTTIVYPPQQSTFDMLLSRSVPAALPVLIEHVRTSPGYNTSSLEQHLLGLHLGAPVRIAHRRDHTETVAHFRPGDVVFMPAGSPVHYAHAAPVEALYISLNPALVRHLSGPFDPPTADVTFAATIGTPDPTIDALGRALLDELQALAVGSRLYVESLLTQLVIHLVRQYATARDGCNGACMAGSAELQARLRPAVDYINEHYRDDVSLADLAAVVHLTPFYFSRLFKRAYHVSPYRYVIQRRIDAAIELVHSSRLTLADIASQVGFADSSHLIRQYRRLTGTTPRAHEARSFN